MADPLGELLDAARARIDRLDPEAVPAAVAAGALLIDIRTADQRRRLGVVDGSIWYPRNVLEWRCAEGAPNLDPAIAETGGRVVLMCMHGFQTSLAAATLRDLGLAQAADVVGGFEGWVAAGMPVRPYDPGRDELQGSERAVVRDY